MRNTTFLLVTFGCFGLVGAFYGDNLLRRSNQHQNGGNIVKRKVRKLSQSNIMIPGDRVSAMDRDSAICSADYDPDQDVAIERTVIDYYYAIESTAKITTDDSVGRSMIRMIEDRLFRAIRPAILWCYFEEPPLAKRNLLLDNGSSSLQGNNLEKEYISRKLYLEETRRLSVVSFSNSPEDEEKPIDCNFPTHDDAHCIVMHGMVTIMHHITSDVSLAVASIFDSTQKAMDYSEIYFALEDDENPANFTNIEWLGETKQDAIYGGPNGNGMIDIGGPNEITVEVSKQGEDEKSMLAYALSVPILILMGSVLLLAKKNVKRKMKTKEQLFAVRSFENVLIGTGDPPGSFHEGMYHYTRKGIRYLSTNCHDCIETKKNGFFTAGDLETITEHSLEEDYDQSAHRKIFFVSPSDTALGVKHSSIDVHNCSSARCPICIYKPRDVEFISKSEVFHTLRSGESEV